MKILDLLNKIANGEEVPKKIKYDEYIYSYVERNRLFAKYIREPFNAKMPYYLFTDATSMNDTVEILEEEKKIPEKLENKIDTTFENYNYSERMRLTEMINKINEIIDCLDYLKSKGE